MNIEYWRWVSWTLFVASSVIWSAKIFVYWKASGQRLKETLNELRIGVVLVLAGISGAAVLIADVFFDSQEMQDIFVGIVRLLFAIVLFTTTLKQPNKKG